MNTKPCWCGNTKLLSFSRQYGECSACGTLVSLEGMAPEQLKVRDDEEDFYGKKYWLGHQNDDLGFPDIHTRARNDLTERNLHWLKALLKYRLPPARVLELGCSHGSFVALLRQAGYAAAGVEMSPWVVEFGQKTFGIPVAVGPIETLDVAPGSLDVIALMDVLEHLPDPVATMAHCLQLLTPNGLLLIQTPQFKEGMKYKALVKTKGAFLEQLKSDEHLYLFSNPSVTRLFQQLGAEHIQFEPAIFGQYDMFFAVSRAELQVNSTEKIELALLGTPSGRLVLAMLDVREREQNLAELLKTADSDRSERAKQIETLSGMFNESEADRTARGEQITSLSKMLKAAQADNATRGVQLESLSKMLKESDADRSERARQIETLSGMLKESETDRAARGEQITSLSKMLKAAQADNATRGAQLESLSKALKESDADRSGRAKQIDTLSGLLKESEADRSARGDQITSLSKMLKESDADRGERAKQIETLSGMLNESEADRAARGDQITSLSEMLKESDADRSERARQIETLSGMLKESETDRAARGQQITSLSKTLKESESDRAARGLQIDELNVLLKQAQADCSAYSKQIEALWSGFGDLYAKPSVQWLIRFLRWSKFKK